MYATVAACGCKFANSTACRASRTTAGSEERSPMPRDGVAGEMITADHKDHSVVHMQKRQSDTRHFQTPDHASGCMYLCTQPTAWTRLPRRSLLSNLLPPSGVRFECRFGRMAGLEVPYGRRISDYPTYDKSRVLELPCIFTKDHYLQTGDSARHRDLGSSRMKPWKQG